MVILQPSWLVDYQVARRTLLAFFLFVFCPAALALSITPSHWPRGITQLPVPAALGPVCVPQAEDEIGIRAVPLLQRLVLPYW